MVIHFEQSLFWKESLMATAKKSGKKSTAKKGGAKKAGGSKVTGGFGTAYKTSKR
jgi:hypothetical protein